jgi:hypothetical protein
LEKGKGALVTIFISLCFSQRPGNPWLLPFEPPSVEGGSKGAPVEASTFASLRAPFGGRGLEGGSLWMCDSCLFSQMIGDNDPSPLPYTMEKTYLELQYNTAYYGKNMKKHEFANI